MGSEKTVLGYMLPMTQNEKEVLALILNSDSTKVPLRYAPIVASLMDRFNKMEAAQLPVTTDRKRQRSK